MDSCVGNKVRQVARFLKRLRPTCQSERTIQCYAVKFVTSNPLPPKTGVFVIVVVVVVVLQPMKTNETVKK